jgi:hypothetical protein
MEPDTIENHLKNSFEIIIKPISYASETKKYQIYGSLLSIIKKLITYNLIKQNYTENIITILREILDYTTEENIQMKVMETLLPLVNPQIINLKEKILNDVIK